MSEPTCLQCKQLMRKIESREIQIKNMSDLISSVLVASNAAIQGISNYSDQDVLKAIAVACSRY